jgi:competence protein ComEC
MRGDAAGLGEWTPWAFVAGAAAYLSLPEEPGLAAWGVVVSVAVLACLAAWRSARMSWFAVAVLGGALVCGAGWTAGVAARVGAPPISQARPRVALEGRVESLELRRNGVRALLHEVRLNGADFPGKVRVGLSARFEEPRIGTRIAFPAALTPPPRPAWPGGFDAARRDWFHGVGAVGYAVGPWRQTAVPAANARLQVWRWQTARSILAASTEGDPRTAVAAALIVGDRGAIPDAVAEDYRASGLAHMLAISGLHMSLLAGLAFFVVRRGLAAVPPVALRFPIKKWAAVAALALTAVYLLLSGASVPTQRAFVMIAIALFAVLLERSPFSFRLLGVAAVAVAGLDPEAVSGPSFQMSFAAVLALIAVYRLPFVGLWPPEREGWLRRPVLYLGGLLLTTAVATCATAPFALYHFGRISLYAVPANLLALPVLGFWVMPWGLLSVAAMPLGLEAFPLARMADGIGWINGVAHAVSTWPGHQVLAPGMGGLGLALCAAGLLWLCLAEGPRRLAGLLGLAAGLVFPLWYVPPDVLIGDAGRAVAVRRGEDYGFSGDRRNAFLAAIWRSGTGRAIRPGAGWTCGARGCVGESSDGWRVTRLDEAEGLGEFCAAAVVVTPLHLSPERRAACGAPLLLDGGDLARGGATALWLDEKGRVLRRVADGDLRGRRPWTRGAGDQ